ncbi:MAG TPA: glycoside hydrolase family 31 protein [Pyrinomonadaceae bacterium]|jgi:alpha-glucosidase|nr:glycoside hydrolase family 31 protein [Pyrinomonadaceae bacterium]
MNKSLVSLCCLAIVLCAASVEAQDIVGGLEPIGPVSSFTKTDAAVTFNCQDGSQVRVSILAPDLIRVRASFKKALPARDHSWAIAKESWDAVRWNVKETTASVTISTDELEVVVRRSPLLVEFRDAKTQQVINQDERPMMFDAKGLMTGMMFDPKAGTFITAAKKLGFDEHFYGLGEKAARLDKRRGYFVNWNSDTPGYTEGKDPIYQTIPFYLGLQKGSAYGIFFDNSYRSYFDFGKSSQAYAAFGAEGGEMNYYFFYGPSIKKILGRYTELTGRMPLPPMWALGNQQSRWSYYPDTMAEEVVRQYRERDLPLDVLHLDIDYMQGYRVFTWNTDRFPNPRDFTQKLKQQGVKVVTIVDPGVKYQPLPKDSRALAVDSARPELMPQDTHYYVFDEGTQKNYFQKRQSGQPFIPNVWPGQSSFVDFTLPDARRWWGDLHRAYTENGVAGIWNDMNEPSDFVDQTGKNQLDVVSFDEGENSTHAKNRNVFALLMARATYEGLERLQPDKRPYIITRAAYAGIQRYSTMWTGDTNSTWDTLALSIPVFQTLGLSGEAFVGSDVGGFIGRGNGELLTRSYQVSFLAPFCRNHKVIDGYDQEPWRFGKFYEDIIRKYLKLRYRLLPFLYTVLEEAHRTGVPLFRPLVLNYQNDSNTLNLDDQFMVGTDLLVAPILQPNQTSRLVYLPEGLWYDFWTGKKYSGGTMTRVDAPLEVVPMFIRGGSIIPEGPEMNYVGEKPFDPLTFYIHPDSSGRAATTLYEDDGTSPAYKRGVYRRTPVTVSPFEKGFEIMVGASDGSYQPGARKFLFVAPFDAPVREVTLDGKRLGPGGSDGKSTGYHSAKGSVGIMIEDDGRQHRIVVR